MKNLENKNNKYKTVIISTVIGMITTALFIVIFAAVMFLAEIDKGYSVIFATASVAIGAFAAAFYAAKTVRSKGFFVGLIVGIVVFISVTLISLVVDKGALGMNTLFHFIIFMLSSLIGGVMGVNNAVNKKYI